ncbi:MAG: HAMP domain-containing protein [Parachlamydiaceae bacterium]|nr:MAG: HAMP domain-containing protein [Parachlamydiaceae bacterium]
MDCTWGHPFTCIDCFLIGIAIMKSIARPLNDLMKAATNFGKGDLSVRVPHC